VAPQGPDTGPHPVSQDELLAVFSSHAAWQINSIAPNRVQTRFHDDHGAPAWLATITRA
jgi:hypothetical protein